MVASVPYVKAAEPHMLETYTPEVTKAYITSRLGSVHSVIRYDDAFLIAIEKFVINTILRWYQMSILLVTRLKLSGKLLLQKIRFYSNL